MAKYNDRLVNKILRLIEEDVYTIGEICDALRISRNSFYEWRNTKPEFRKAIEDAEDRRDDALANLARKSLREKIEGCIITTERITYADDGYGGETMKSKVVIHKKCQPDTRAIKIALERQDKKRERNDADTSVPKQEPIVIKFPQGTDPQAAEDSIRSFLKRAREKGKVENDIEEENEDSMYRSVII